MQKFFQVFGSTYFSILHLHPKYIFMLHHSKRTEFVNTWQTSSSFTALELTSNFCQLTSGQFKTNAGYFLGDSSNTWISKFVSLLVWLMILILKKRERNTLSLSDVFEGKAETSIWECICCYQLVWLFWIISVQSEGGLLGFATMRR